MARIIRSVRGMSDLLPEETAQWRRVEAVARECFSFYGYGEIRTPVLERTELFRRQLGEHTELVEKEMYTFVDALNDESLTLRPEATVSTMRALIEHGLLSGHHRHRLYYMGPMFRHERPQQGRYRQFHQMGAEAVGYDGPGIDVEMVLMLSRLWRLLGIGASVRLKVNNLGNTAERARHRKDLSEHFMLHKDRLDENSLRRMETNPLRVLDSKLEQTRAVAAVAPLLEDYLESESRSFFDRFVAGLEAAGVRFERDHRLVRGLDYYSNTVFEWIYDADGKELTVCGGGRYNGLAEQIGSKPVSGCGFALGVERLMSLVRTACSAPVPEKVCDAFVVFAESAASHAVRVAEMVRNAGFKVVMDPDGGSFKSQLRKANASGAAVALLLGDDEASSDMVTVKPLRDGAEQFRIDTEMVGDRLKRILSGHA